MVVKEINEVEEFQKTIDTFKKDILEDRKTKLIKKKYELNDKIQSLSNRYNKKID